MHRSTRGGVVLFLASLPAFSAGIIPENMSKSGLENILKIFVIVEMRNCLDKQNRNLSAICVSDP